MRYVLCETKFWCQSSTLWDLLNDVRLLTLTPFARFWIQIVGIQSVWFFNVFEHLTDIHDAISIRRIARDVTQVRKLQMQCAEFWENTASATRPTVIFAALYQRNRNNRQWFVSHRRRCDDDECTYSCSHIDQSIRNSRWCLESWQQFISDMLCFLLVHWISGEAVQCQKSTDETDVCLEHGQFGALKWRDF